MTSIENIIPLFSTPLYFVEDKKSVFKFDEDQLNFIKNLDYKFVETNSTTENNQILNFPELKNLKKHIQKHIDLYTDKFIDKEHNDYKFEICSSWATKNETGQSHKFHKHLTSVISGIINVTPNNCTIFSRENLGPFPFFSFEYKNYGVAFAEKISILQENPGSILLFPSNVFHAVSPNTLETNRYSISFNVFVRGNFSSYPEQTIV